MSSGSSIVRSIGSLTWMEVALRTRRERFHSAAGASMYQGSSYIA